MHEYHDLLTYSRMNPGKALVSVIEEYTTKNRWHPCQRFRRNDY